MTLVATDLDGTLVYSRRTAGAGDPGAWVPVEVRDGAATGWMTATAAGGLTTLARSATWVPATTRTVAQFRRLRLPPARWVVCAQGGVLLVDGVPDATWAARVAAVVARVATLDVVAAVVERLAGPVRRADGLFLTGAPPARADLVARCAELGWIAHVGPRKVHVVPDGLTKTAAVDEVRRRVGAGGWLAAGDSALDADLLAHATAGIRPAHGELHDRDWRADHVAVTTAAGIGAGGEIVAWLLDRS